MKRRSVLKSMLAAPAGLTLGLTPMLSQAYTGKLFVFVQAEGGWDPTSFCDPKTNVLGEPEINHWAQTGDIQQAGNLSYAPFANNAAFFNKYYQRMLVINGVDAQTNSHTVGVVHNWSGRVAEGYPSMTALLAAENAPELAMSYLNFGGYGVTGGLLRSTRIDDASQITNIAYPNVPAYDDAQRYLGDDDFASLQAFQATRADVLNAQVDVMPRASLNRSNFASAGVASADIKSFADLLPPAEELAPEGPQRQNLQRQAQVAVLAFRAGIAVSADLYIRGFDTHSNHDADHAPLLAYLTDSVDYLWDYAEAEGVADRLVVVMGSDFGRTPRYNSSDGKDHWPIGSYVVMEKNVPWTNRVAGETDEGHSAYAINPMTLARDDANGTTIYPAHVHKALRNYLGLGGTSLDTLFPFNSTEDFTFFS